MGVMGCNKNGCDSIMCDLLSDTYGYICRDCFEELVATGPRTDIIEFMRSEKQEGAEKEARARYEAVFNR